MNFTAPEQQTLKLSQSPACFRMADDNQVFSYGSPPFVRFWTYLTKFLKNITVEPVVFLYAVGFSLTMVVSPALYFEKICRVSHFLRNPYQGEKTRVRARTWTCKTGWFEAYLGNNPFYVEFRPIFATFCTFICTCICILSLLSSLFCESISCTMNFRLKKLSFLGWQLYVWWHDNLQQNNMW